MVYKEYRASFDEPKIQNRTSYKQWKYKENTTKL